PSIQIDAVRPGLPISLGYMRGGGEALTGFATESFVDEMARALNADPFSLRLAKALTAVTAIGGWDGGRPGSTMGLAAASAFGSHIALLVQAGVGPDQRV